MNYAKMMIKSIFVFGAVLGITFSANAMKRHHDDYKIDYEQLKKKYTFADDYELEKENLTENQLKNLERAHQERLVREEDRKQLLINRKQHLGRVLRNEVKPSNQKSTLTLLTPMPLTPMPLRSGKGIQGTSFAACPVKLPIYLNALYEEGNFGEMRAILENPDNDELLQSFNGYHNGGNLVNNAYLSDRRFQQINNNNNNKS